MKDAPLPRCFCLKRLTRRRALIVTRVARYSSVEGANAESMSRTIHFVDKGVRARTAASEPDVLARLAGVVGAENVLVDEERVEPYAGDALKEKFPPEAVVLPRT
ncbi:MAG: hypothetical protein QOC61_2031, partial [Acidobacteriota bacterium]|nr:hypothetical protein [Acidobacteriota bacterium]